MTERERRNQPSDPARRIRSFTSCTFAGIRFIPLPRSPSRNLLRAGREARLSDRLGVTAVELLPVDEFDENDCPFVNPLTGERLKNYWGYNPIAFGAPKAAYAVNPSGPSPGTSFAAWSACSTAAGIEVILDIVFNHTAEGGEGGPDLQLPRARQLTLLHARRAAAVT